MSMRMLALCGSLTSCPPPAVQYTIGRAKWLFKLFMLLCGWSLGPKKRKRRDWYLLICELDYLPNSSQAQTWNHDCSGIFTLKWIHSFYSSSVLLVPPFLIWFLLLMSMAVALKLSCMWELAEKLLKILCPAENTVYWIEYWTP